MSEAAVGDCGPNQLTTEESANTLRDEDGEEADADADEIGSSKDAICEHGEWIADRFPSTTVGASLPLTAGGEEDELDGDGEIVILADDAAIDGAPLCAGA